MPALWIQPPRVPHERLAVPESISKKILMWSMLVAIENGIDFQDSRDCLRQMSSVADAESH